MPFPIALFMVSKQMYEDADEVFWSQRFVLRGDFRDTAIWLNNLGEQRVSRIRKMDLVVDGDQVWDIALSIFLENREECLTEPNLQILIESIQQKYNLGKLWSSVDVRRPGSLIAIWEDFFILRDGGIRGNLPQTCEALFKPVVSHFQGQCELAKFHVILGWGPDDEAATERAVMGAEYDSALEGKVAFNDRDVRDPHRRRTEDKATMSPPRAPEP